MEDKVAIITGSTSGIGADIAKQMAGLGAKAVIVGRRQEKGEEVVSEIKRQGGEAMFFKADVSESSECKELFNTVVKNYGTVHILVNSAGTTKDAYVTEMTDEEWDSVIKTNLRSCFLCCREASIIMKAQKYGRIINIGSRGWLGGSAQCNYAASKGGIVSLTRALALELAKYGITVNNVSPGMIDTDLFRKSDPEAVKFRMQSQPMGRVGEVSDITRAVLYFADESNSFVTGQTLYVCGGMSVLASLS